MVRGQDRIIMASGSSLCPVGMVPSEMVHALALFILLCQLRARIDPASSVVRESAAVVFSPTLGGLVYRNGRQSRQRGSCALPYPDGDGLGGRVLEPLDLVQALMIE